MYDFLRAQILPLEEINKAIPKKSKVVELGCGEGVISRYLALTPSRQITGIDIDKSRLKVSSKKNIKFICADITKTNLKGFDSAVISDVLHHLKKKDQKKLLEHLSKSFRKDDVLVIKEIDTKEFIRCNLSRLWDFLLYPKDKISYWDSDTLRTLLSDLNFNVQVKRTNRLFPGSTTLFICKKS